MMDILTYEVSTVRGQGQTITLLDADGVQTIWTYAASQWQPTSVVQTGDAAQNTSSYYFDTTATSPTFGLPTRIVAPSPAGVDCSSATKADATQGCRSLSFGYSSITVGSGSVQRLSSVSVRAWNPLASPAAMQTTQLEAYDYDSTGRLAHEWDPRISPALKTGYTYDSAGRLSTLTPPGLATWTMHYDSTGRLSSVTRPDPSGATATTTVVYDVPISGSNAPIDLTYASVLTWGQYADIPVVGTAVFDPDHVPAGTTASTVSGSDWPLADLTYTDYLGNPTNTASYGAGDWQIDSSMYDANGNVFWNLSAGNRAQALHPSADTDPWVAAQSSSTTRAGYLTTYSIYDAEQNLAIQAGPMHPVTLPDGSVIDARDAEYVTYNAGAPAGEDMELQTGDTYYAYGSDGANYDALTTTTTYDPIDGASNTGPTSGWTLGAPTTVTDPGGLVTKTRYNSAGQTVEQDLPATSASAGQRTTLSSYYTATGSGPCVSVTVTGLLCSTAPKTQPATGSPLPVTTYSYDMYDNPSTKTETYGTGSSQVVRTTTTGYDTAERQTGSSIVVLPASAGGTAVPPVSDGYSSTTGLPTTVSTMTGGTTTTLTTGYDNLGQKTSYTDATGNVSTTGYDLDGRPTSSNDGKGTTTWTYDSSTEHRGLVTGENIGVAGAPSDFSASYDAAGNLAVETYPSGLTATSTFDNTGNDTSLTYAQNGSTWMSFTQASNTHGQVITQSSPESSQTYAYDGSDRLTSVQDSDNGACTTRKYSFDNDSNRTELDSYPAATDGTCTTSTTLAAQTTSYDTADRDTNSRYAYDTLGRTLSVPAGDALGIGTHAGTTGTLTLGYNANDMVASETQGSATQTFTLDPLQDRINTSSDGTTTTTDHYNDNTDSPAWTSTSSNTWSRDVHGIDGSFSATSDQGSVVILQLKNLHGDVIATAADNTSTAGIGAYDETNEYGQARNPLSVNSSSYGYLGTKQRSDNALGGLILMGARLYNGVAGRFLQQDPVEGGNANRYIYPDDPINHQDTSGQRQGPSTEGGLPLPKGTRATGTHFDFKPHRSGTSKLRGRPGYRDDHDNIWKKDTAGHYGGGRGNHWDVSGKYIENQYGEDHLNIDGEGRIIGGSLYLGGGGVGDKKEAW